MQDCSGILIERERHAGDGDDKDQDRVKLQIIAILKEWSAMHVGYS